MSLRVIDPRDNVAVQIGEGGAVPSGHKVARRAIAQGEFVIKYGEIIGRATQDIAPGEWVHTHNLRSHLDEGAEYHYQFQPVSLPPREGSFWGYPRPWGDVGIRNEIYILPTVGCVNPICQRLAQEAQPLVGGSLDGIFALPHQFGCSQLGEDGEIIYLTASDGYAVDSYDVRAFFYLLKPVEQKRLFRVLDQAVDKLRKRREEAVVVPTRGGARRVPLERIRYVERVGRVMRYCCTDGVVDSLTLRGSFREKAEPLLADPRFHLCGASFVLNLQHVAGVEGRTALLDDGSRIFLPRAAAAAFKEAWGRFWLEGRGL